MKQVIVSLKSTAPYYQSRPFDPANPAVAKQDREGADDHEKRVWRERLHYTEDEEVFIPGAALKNCLSEAAKYLNKQIAGKGKATYTKHFEAGVMVPEDVPLGIKKEDVLPHRLFLPADGKRGSGKRVWKYMPQIPKWSATATVLILDEIITKDVFKEVLEEAGKFIGIGAFRPRNNGTSGRFSVEHIDWPKG